jgi:hypothetical protein
VDSTVEEKVNRVVRVKDGVDFKVIAPAGFRILGAIETTARRAGVDLVITSACDGVHSGFDDPHHRGEAYDLRTNSLAPADKTVVLNCLIALLPIDQFYCFLEAPNTPNEHIHAQIKKGTVYP